MGSKRHDSLSSWTHSSHPLHCRGTKHDGSMVMSKAEMVVPFIVLKGESRINEFLHPHFAPKESWEVASFNKLMLLKGNDTWGSRVLLTRFKVLRNMPNHFSKTGSFHLLVRSKIQEYWKGENYWMIGSCHRNMYCLVPEHCNCQADSIMKKGVI